VVSIAGSAVAGAFVTWLALRAVERRLTSAKFVRENYRGASVIAPGGLALVPAVIVGLAWSQLLDGRARTALAIAGAAVATAALGLVDDLRGDRHAGGFVGHARALLEGNFTTGMLKASGGAVVGLAAAWMLGFRGVWLLVAGAVVALSSNLANLLDLRPGRVAKVWLPLDVLMVFASSLGRGRAVLCGIGGGVVVFLVWELRERGMLGDVGAGLLGVALGTGAVAVLGRPGLLVLVGALLALTVASELVSFTRVIDATPPLRFVDRLGRSRD
jgi:UDP-N-acetylmuramyl pentapeptide phosphotransferase/UDP-N-acetylglucosamine-1-phosphate transferase